MLNVLNQAQFIFFWLSVIISLQTNVHLTVCKYPSCIHYFFFICFCFFYSRKYLFRIFSLVKYSVNHTSFLNWIFMSSNLWWWIWINATKIDAILAIGIWNSNWWILNFEFSVVQPDENWLFLGNRNLKFILLIYNYQF